MNGIITYFKKITEGQSRWIASRFNVKTKIGDGSYVVIRYTEEGDFLSMTLRNVQPINTVEGDKVIEIDSMGKYPIEVEMVKLYLNQSSIEICKELAEKIALKLAALINKSVAPEVTVKFFQDVIDFINEAKVTPYKG